MGRRYVEEQGLLDELENDLSAIVRQGQNGLKEFKITSSVRKKLRREAEEKHKSLRELLIEKRQFFINVATEVASQTSAPDWYFLVTASMDKLKLDS